MKEKKPQQTKQNQQNPTKSTHKPQDKTMPPYTKKANNKKPHKQQN